MPPDPLPDPYPGRKSNGKVAVARGPGKFDNNQVLGRNFYRFEALGEIYKSRRVPEPENGEKAMETGGKIAFARGPGKFDRK